jgi:hypothetical protein
MDDRMSVDVVDAGHDALPEFLFRCHADVSEDGAGEFGEEPLDEVEPGAMLRRKGEGETSARSRIEPSSGFSRDVCGMIVEDQLDSGVGWISGVEKLEEFDELAAAVAVPDECMDLASVSRSIPANRLSVP